MSLGIRDPSVIHLGSNASEVNMEGFQRRWWDMRTQRNCIHPSGWSNFVHKEKYNAWSTNWPIRKTGTGSPYRSLPLCFVSRRAGLSNQWSPSQRNFQKVNAKWLAVSRDESGSELAGIVNLWCKIYETLKTIDYLSKNYYVDALSFQPKLFKIKISTKEPLRRRFEGAIQPVQLSLGWNLSVLASKKCSFTSVKS